MGIGFSRSRADRRSPLGEEPRRNRSPGSFERKVHHMTINAYRLSVLAAGVVGVLGAGLVTASAQQQPQIPQGWFKACTKQEDVDICNVQNIVTAGNGQLVTGV